MAEQTIQRIIATASVACVETIESRLLLSANVLTYHNDAGRTGANLNETTLTPTNIASSRFGKQFTLKVDGQVYAQPLVLNQVNVPGMGKRDVVVVATQHDSVYSFDVATGLNASGGSTIIQARVEGAPVPGRPDHATNPSSHSTRSGKISGRPSRSSTAWCTSAGPPAATTTLITVGSWGTTPAP